VVRVPPLPYQTAPPSSTPTALSGLDDTEKITVAVDAMPLEEFLHRVFGDLLGVNYLISPQVSSREQLSLNLSQPVTRRQLLQIVTGILADLKLQIREEDGLFVIERAGASLPLTPAFAPRPEELPETTGQIRSIVPLQYLDPQTVVLLLSGIPDAKILPLPDENAVTVTGSRDGVRQVLQFLSVIDRPALRGRHAALLRLTYWQPQEILDKLKEILGAEGIPLADGPRGSGLRLIPLDRWRQILVFAAEKTWLDRAAYWVRTLDTPEETQERRYFLFFPENSRAEELKTTLENILGLPAAGSDGSRTPRRLDLMEPAASADQKTEPKQGASAAVPSGPAPRTASGDTVRIAVDASRNALVFYTTPQEYRRIQDLVRRLDVMPAQVLIEATVAEVTLTDDLQFGIEWYLKNTDGRQTSILQTLGGLALGSSGLNFSLVTDSEKFKALINALARKDLVKILSSPRLTVRDGKSATINVGSQIPVVTSETGTVESITDTGTAVLRSYQYRTTGVTMQVTPTVHAQGVLTLEISQEVSEPSSSGTENPIILNRSLTTEVVARTGQTVLLGGLIRESSGTTVDKVPVLGDLPLLGAAFRNTTRGTERTELVIMLTPHIIRSPQQIDDLTRAIFENFQHIRPDPGGLAAGR
jgi:general secretion pathway protein D